MVSDSPLTIESPNSFNSGDSNPDELKIVQICNDNIVVDLDKEEDHSREVVNDDEEDASDIVISDSDWDVDGSDGYLNY